MERSICVPTAVLGIGISRGLLILVCLASILVSCNVEISKKNNVCTPECNGEADQCKDDGCGSLCPCDNPDLLCNAAQECKAVDVCEGGCDGRECGSVCGAPCGFCVDGEKCVAGLCECAPQCDGVHCGQDDGCGVPCACEVGQACIDSLCVDGDDVCAAKECGTWGGKSCGTCDGEELCNAQGKCVLECDDVCGDVGWQCGGTVCHDECGPCASGEICVNHVCECQPDCPDGFCGDDGCGASCSCGALEKCDAESNECVACGPAGTNCGDRQCGTVCGDTCGKLNGECENDETCVDGECLTAALKLTLVSAEYSEADERVHGTIQIDYLPAENANRPRMADIRVDTSRSVGFEIESVTLGIAATQSDKTLYIDPISLKPWRYRPDGAVQMLVHTDVAGLEDADATIGVGALVTINFTCLLSDDDPATGILENSVNLSIVRRNQIFAPFEADLSLQETAYDTAVLVKK